MDKRYSKGNNDTTCIFYKKTNTIVATGVKAAVERLLVNINESLTLEVQSMEAGCSFVQSQEFSSR